MPLLIRRSPEGRDGPVFVCDWCGRRIENIAEGVAEWVVDRRGEPENGTIYYAHVEHARVPLSSPGQGPQWRDVPLSSFLRDLLDHSVGNPLDPSSLPR